MRFIQQWSEGTKIEYELHEDAELNTILEEFQNFLRACGYVIEYNQVIDLVTVDDDFCTEEEAKLVKANAHIRELQEALQWCSGSDDFHEGGIAREGWLRLCAPLLKGRDDE